MSTNNNNTLNLESHIYRLTGLTPILGTAPASRTVRTEYVASKAPTPELMQEEIDMHINLEDKGLTVFYRNSQDQLCVSGHQVKGFFKEALKALKPTLNIAASQSKVDTLLFVEPRFAPIKRDGEALRDEDDVLERPLRAQTMQGERVALTASEMVNDPWEIEIEITLLPSTGTPKSRALSWEAIETALDYGAYRGLCQWRNAGWGRFVWERVDDDE